MPSLQDLRDTSTPDIPSPRPAAAGAIGTPRRGVSYAGSPIIADSCAQSNIWNVSSSRAVSAGNSTRFHMNGLHGQTASGAGSCHMSNMWSRYTWLKDADQSKNAFIEEVLTRQAMLVDENEQLKRDTAQRQLTGSSPAQSQIQAYQSHCEKLFNLLNRGAFVAVLIDGNGMLFNADFIRDGEVGGKKAAYLLKTMITEWIVTEKDGPALPTGWRLVARVYANVRGLADACVKAGIISSTTVFEDFVRGFTLGDPLFDFIDVGDGQDQAEIKVTANFATNLAEYACRQILFGCNPDSGVARVLKKYAEDPEVLSKVTLLGGTSFEREAHSLPFEQKQLPGLFNGSKLVATVPDMVTDPFRNRHDSRNQFNANSAVFTPTSQTPAPQTPVSGFSPGTVPRHASSDAVSSLRGDLTRTNSNASVSMPETPAANASLGGGGWASVARANKNLPLKDLTKPTVVPKVAGPVIFLNKKGQRIDKKMEYDHEKVYRLKQIKLCNQHYIGRGCCHHQAQNHACPHNHSMTLNKDDLKWLRVVARETVCKKGTSCLDFDCIYGHHCPYPKLTEGSQKGINCINGDNCRFAKEMHGMDMEVADTLKEEDVMMHEDY